MDASTDWINIFRSADSGATEEAAVVSGVLEQAGIASVVLEDDAPDVPPGTVVVRVAAGQEQRAERALAASRNRVPDPVDNSASLNLVTVFEGVGLTGELEALSLRGVLDANNVASVLEGSSTMPNLPFLVKVARMQEAEALQMIAEARAAGVETVED
ncbi:MAG: hypothetical protein JJE04_07665 [Acidobacteriia bacterium]|nr:hypothetical protein [Terriglobia bacterium]